MSGNKKQYLFIEPYYGGSHKRFIEGLTAHIEGGNIRTLSLPARKWKMRMQLAAPYMAEKVISQIKRGEHFDAVITSTFLDLAVFRALLANQGIWLPTAVYFHENQFAYPSRPQDRAGHQFTSINFTTALCADFLAFNSSYNRETFFSGISRYLKKAADMSFEGTLEALETKSRVLPLGLDFQGLGEGEEGNNREKVPVIVWNHRWEHDKNPETFFTTLFELAEQGAAFKVIVLGESFRDQPEIFARAEKMLCDHILHFGYAKDREEYCRLLGQGTIAVSTAVHEFFGIAVLEAVRAGSLPLVPDRLAYRELFPREYRYRSAEFKKRLRNLINTGERLPKMKRLELTEPYSWDNMAGEYNRWLQDVSSSPAQISTMSPKKMVLRR